MIWDRKKGDFIPEKYCLYVHINPTNNKTYIGITQNIKSRWRNKEKGYRNCTLIYNALKKYGWDNFVHVVLFDNMDKEEACKKEKMWIKAFKEVGLSYNITDGGEGTAGVKRSEAHKQILREYMRNRVVSEETRRKCGNTKRMNHTMGKKIYAFDIETKELVKEYMSINDAARDVGVNCNGIIKAAKGNRPSSGGYIWSYKPFIDRNNPIYKGIGKYQPRKVYCYDLHGNFTKTYNSSTEAAKEVGGLARAINACCTKDIVSYKHFIWRYELCEIEENVLNKIRFKRHEVN